MSKNLPQKNQEITAEKVRLIDSDGTMVGVMTTSEALQKASSQGLDLVVMSPDAKLPVCKLLDFGKYRYESKKKKTQAKKKQKTVELKEIKLRPNIGENDLNIKIRHIKKFIEDGHKVKITVRFRGREITHNELGLQLAQKIFLSVEEIARAETEARIEGHQVLMILGPK